MADIMLQIATCNTCWDDKYTQGQITWQDLCTKLGTTKRTKETIAEYMAMDKKQQGRIKDVGGFLLGTLKDDKKMRDTIMSRSAIALDLDYAPTDFWGRFTLEWDYAACIYSTHKHQPTKPRIRLIIPLSKPVSPDAYEAIARKIAHDWADMMWFDDTSFQPSRMMFWPSTSADGEYIFESQDGPILDPQVILDRYEGDWHDLESWDYSQRVTEKRISFAKKQADPTAKDGIVGSFCRTYTIQQAIEKYLPDVYTPTDRDDRWTYAAGSGYAGLVIYDNDTLAYSNHSTDPAGNMHCLNAFDLVRIHKFRDQDEDKKPDQIGVNLPSYKAMADLALKDEAVCATRSIDMFDKAAEKLPDQDETGVSKQEWQEENRDWQALLSKNPKTGKPDESIENALIILQNDTKLKGFGRYNEFRDMVEKTASLPWWKYNQYNADWKDSDTKELFAYMEIAHQLKVERVIKHARDIMHTRHSYHPVRDYLEALPAWDGIERLDTLLVDYMAADDTPYVRAVTRKTLVAAIKRIMEPGCKVDTVLTLAGKQGIKKSSFFRLLVPDQAWFSDSLDTFQGKEAYEALLGAWILEIAELSAVKRSDVERVKQFITKQDDRYRKAYGEKVETVPRQCIFVATTNSNDFLRDMTGNRRWWVVPVNAGGAKEVFTDLPAERDQIWAEALMRYKAGEPIYLDNDQLVEAAAQMQDEFTFKSAKYELIENYLDLELPEKWRDMSLEDRKSWLESGQMFTSNEPIPGAKKRDTVCLLEIWMEVFDGKKANFSNIDQREIKDILLKLGWTKAKGNRSFGKAYGHQRAWLRPETVYD